MDNKSAKRAAEEPREQSRARRREKRERTLVLLNAWLRSSSPLRPPTRILGKWLLFSSAGAYVMATAQLIPVELVLFGLKFQSIDAIRVQHSAATLFALFAVGYVGRIGSDVVHWFEGHFASLKDSKQGEAVSELFGPGRHEYREIEAEIIDGEADRLAHGELLFSLRSPRVVPLAALLEILAPYAAALFVIWVLIRR